ncbi:hypothetical protein AB0G74_20435 [Streptomyces sp. NPDC020875]|uniref:hypothetical protein n=1 Tax=Streptomyces sp. NPDC020875 TaxID=3154898 RepID=UPI0033FA1BD4
MNALHQHTLDSYRASRHGAPIPPRPGDHDWRAARELTSQALLVRRAARVRRRPGPSPARSLLAGLARLPRLFRRPRSAARS